MSVKANKIKKNKKKNKMKFSLWQVAQIIQHEMTEAVLQKADSKWMMMQCNGI